MSIDPSAFGSARFTAGQDTTDQSPTEDTTAPQFGEFSPGTDTPFDHFTKAAEDAARKAAEDKGEKFDLEKFHNDLRLFLFQHYMNNSIGDFTKDRRNTIEKSIEVASDQVSAPSFVSKAKLINGEEVEIGKVRVNKTKPSTSVTSPKDFLDWAKHEAPDLTTTRTVLNPHLSPEDEAKAYAILREHMPEAVTDIVELKKNALDLLTEKTVTQGNDVVIPAHETVDEETGEVVAVPEKIIPGLRHDNGGKFKNITIEAGPTKDKFQPRVMDLLIRNQFEGVSTNEIIKQTQNQLESKK